LECDTLRKISKSIHSVTFPKKNYSK
jgi:hypothetical protein